MAHNTRVDGVLVKERNIKKLSTLYKKSYIKIVREIEGATNFGVANRRAILKQIEVILEGLGVDVDNFIRSELPQYYKQGADDAIKQLREVDAPIPTPKGFNNIHKQAIEALVDETATAFGESLTGVKRSATRLLGKATREALTQRLAEGQITGEALKEVKKTIVGTLRQDGLASLIDKGGKKWELDTYAEMLIRTKAVEARNRGLANRMAENDYDLVQVSDHNSDHEECAVWEGQILSLTGATKGYPTLAEAEASGLFHPNCKHAINVMIPRLAKITNAYDPDTETYKIPNKEAVKITRSA
jgi:hypothetical protein